MAHGYIVDVGARGSYFLPVFQTWNLQRLVDARAKNQARWPQAAPALPPKFFIFFAGKSTLLRALAVGVYDKAPGDGREFAVTDPNAVTVRAEDGRSVSGVDISPFISALPTSVARPAQESDEGAEKGSGRVGATVAVAEAKTPAATSGEGVERDCRSTKCFSTRGASGSTSQAANVMEALEAGATALLLDEDTCAGNVGVL